MLKEVHARECREHRGRKKLYQCIFKMGYYLATMRKDTVVFVKKCHDCQVQANLIHTYPQSLQGMVTPWPFYTWRLGGTGQSAFQYVQMDPCGHKIFHQMGGGHTTSQSHR